MSCTSCSTICGSWPPRPARSWPRKTARWPWAAPRSAPRPASAAPPAKPSKKPSSSPGDARCADRGPLLRAGGLLQVLWLAGVSVVAAGDGGCAVRCAGPCDRFVAAWAVACLSAGMPQPGRARRGRAGSGFSSADGGQQPEVVREAGEQELAGGVGQAAEAEAAQPAAVFEAGVQSLDVGGAALAERAAFGGGQPVRVGLHGGGIVGRGPLGGLAAGQVAGLGVGDEPVRAGSGEVRLAVVAGVFDQGADPAGHGVMQAAMSWPGSFFSLPGRVHIRPWQSASRAGSAAWAAWAAATTAAPLPATRASSCACCTSPVSWQA